MYPGIAEYGGRNIPGEEVPEQPLIPDAHRDQVGACPGCCAEYPLRNRRPVVLRDHHLHGDTLPPHLILHSAERLIGGHGPGRDPGVEENDLADTRNLTYPLRRNGRGRREVCRDKHLCKHKLRLR